MAENIAQEYLEGLLQGNRVRCSALAHEYLKVNPSFKDLYEEVFKHALYAIGALWESNKITVATEHMATAITEGILNELFEKVMSGERMNKKVVLACSEDEKHQVGIKMVADLFEMNGWESYFLGTGIPTRELVKFIGEVQPDVVAISLSIYFNYAKLVSMIETIRNQYPELLILVGGQAFKHIPEDGLAMIPRVMILSDLYMLDNLIKTLNKQ